MKKSFAILGALPLAIVLSSCSQVSGLVESVAGHSYSKNIAVDGTVETPTGSYQSIKRSDDFINAVVHKVEAEGRDQKITNPETGEIMEYSPSPVRSYLTEFFFDKWIDSPALEGDQAALTEWTNKAIADGTFSSSEWTKSWAEGGKGGWVIPALTTTKITTSGGPADVAIDGFIHDGKPRMTDASIDFGDATWVSNADGTILSQKTTFYVDYRVSDATAKSMLMAYNKYSAEEVDKYLTDEAKDGKGENKLHVYGNVEWFVQMDGTMAIYQITPEPRYSLESVIRPEFHTAAPAPSS